MKAEQILDEIEKIYPETPCELSAPRDWRFVIAALLSAQNKDTSTNAATDSLFQEFPDLKSLAQAPVDAIREHLKGLRHFNRKAENVSSLAKILLEQYGGEVPCTLEELMKLPGIGRKSANIILDNVCHLPSLGVDTHVERCTKRLGIVDFENSPLQIEQKLKEILPESRWSKAHNDFIHFGRYFCTSRKPQCESCPLKSVCKKGEYDQYLSEKKLKKSPENEGGNELS